MNFNLRQMYLLATIQLKHSDICICLDRVSKFVSRAQKLENGSIFRPPGLRLDRKSIYFFADTLYKVTQIQIRPFSPSMNFLL